jgi:branched-chain amino acid transport system permease protein
MMRPQVLTWALALILLMLAPLWLSPHWEKTFTLVLLFIYWACAWNIIGGLAGEINFLHPLFMATGAYTSTMLYLKAGMSPWVGMMIGGILSSILGVTLGWVCYRSGLPHLSFALITLGFTYIGQIIANAWEWIGASVGLIIRPRPGFWNLQFTTNAGYYYVALGLALLGVGISLWISRAKLGYYLSAIRHNEEAAEAVGVDSVKFRLIALSISAFLTAMGGTFYAQLIGYIEPHSAVNIEAVIEIILFTVVGGYGTVWGPVIGASLLMPIGEVVRAQWPGFHLVVYGLVVIAVIIFAPHGVAPLLKGVITSREQSPT